MDDAAFGFKMTVLGMGGTLLTVWVLVVMVQLLKRVFPFRKDDRRQSR